MAKSRAIEDQLAALHALKACPSAPETRTELSRALGHKVNLVVAKAAAVAADCKLADLGSDMAKAFDRFMVDPVKTDRSCAAKTAIVKALFDLESDARDVFLAGIHHVQLEPAYGGDSDTAGELRGYSALALVRMGYRQVMPELTDLLVDRDMQARIAAIRALAGTGREDAALLIRLKLLTGDKEPDVMAEGFHAMLQLAPESGVPFVGRYLNGPSDDLAEAAALALGQCRQPAAFALLRDQWTKSRGAISPETLFLAIALSRLPESVTFLLGIIADGLATDALLAVKAMHIYKHDAGVCAQIRELATKRQDASIATAAREVFA